MVSPDQTNKFVDMVYKSAGDRSDIYRVVLKKALHDNIDNLRLMEKGRLT